MKIVDRNPNLTATNSQMCLKIVNGGIQANLLFNQQGSLKQKATLTHTPDEFGGKTTIISTNKPLLNNVLEDLKLTNPNLVILEESTNIIELPGATAPFE